MGQIIRYVKVKSGDGVQPVELANIKDIDVKSYKNYLHAAFRQVLDALDLEVDEKSTQINLESFFGNTT